MALPSRTFSDYAEDGSFWLSRALNRSLGPPDWVSVNLTLKCNLACSFCKTCYPVRHELTTREVKDIIDQVHLWGVKRFNPLGGEPFVRRDLEEILAYACEKDFYITLTTNGTLITAERAARIAQIPYNRLHFNVSIDGPRAHNDRVRGQGNFDRAVQGVRLLRQADEAAGSPLRKICINTLINNHNLQDLPAFLFWCRDDLGVQGVQFLNLFRHNNRIDPDIADQWIPDSRIGELDDLVDFLVGFAEHEADTGFGLVNDPGDLLNMKKYYRGEMRPLDGKCWSGWKELYINADGSAIMCDGKLDFLNGSFGNVRERTLRELWGSQDLALLRRHVKSCTTPCIQDCYLRRRSDSAVKIARGVAKLAYHELKRKYVRRAAEPPRFPDAVLTLELSDSCDVKCTYCKTPPERFAAVVKDSRVDFAEVRRDPFQFYELRNKGYLNFNRGFMSMDIMRRVISDLQASGTAMGRIRLGWQGEPLLHPQTEEILRLFFEENRRRRFTHDIEVPTNATLLNHSLCRLATEYGDVPQTWYFNVDGFGKDAYAAVKGQPIWDRVLDNINFMLKMVQERRPPRLRMVFQFMVCEASEPHAAEFRRGWTEHLATYGIDVGLAGWRQPAGPGHWLFVKREDSDDNPRLREIRERYARVLATLGLPTTDDAADETAHRTCSAYWKTPTISWDGKVLLCTVDTTHQMKVGEATVDDLGRIWWDNPRLHDIRKQAVREDFFKLNRCRECKAPYSPNCVPIERPEIDGYFERSRG